MLHLLHMDASHDQLILETDCAAFDITSAQIFLQDLARLYAGVDLPELPAAFHPYENDALPRPSRAKKAKDRQYWMEKIQHMEGTPFQEQAAVGTLSVPASYSSHSAVLPTEQVAFLERFAADAATNLQMVLLTLFVRAIAKTVQKEQFLLNIPVLDRSNVDAAYRDTAADYTVILMFAVDHATEQDFRAQLCALSKQYQEDLAHASFSGINVQQRLAEARQQTVINGNVTFSSHIDRDLADPVIRQCFGTCCGVHTETPNVVMDGEFFRVNGSILMNLVTPDQYLPIQTEETLLAYMLEEVNMLADYENQ